MRIDGAPVFVLHRRAWRDTSLLVELLSADHGRIGAVARGARNPRSALFGLVEPFRELQASWSRRGEMATLSALDSDRPPVRLVGRALWCGLYANELILRLLPRDDPEPDLYTAYSTLLPDLTEPARQAAALRRFEVSLLSVLGLMPALDR
ncbi:MAG: DNA repair protein RecO, partial [Wenzhouxiangellaceae bacterium]